MKLRVSDAVIVSKLLHGLDAVQLTTHYSRAALVRCLPNENVEKDTRGSANQKAIDRLILILRISYSSMTICMLHFQSDRAIGK